MTTFWKALLRLQVGLGRCHGHIYTLVAVVVYVCPLDFIHECLMLLGPCSHVISVIRGMNMLSDWDPQFKSVGYKCTESVIGPLYLGLLISIHVCVLVEFK